jgi:hypothetical protein
MVMALLKIVRGNLWIAVDQLNLNYQQAAGAFSPVGLDPL